MPEHSDSDQSENQTIDDDGSPYESNPAQNEEEEWAGIENITVVHQGNFNEGKGKPNRPPVGEELRVIKDAADLFRSSSFKLQVCTPSLGLSNLCYILFLFSDRRTTTKCQAQTFQSSPTRPVSALPPHIYPINSLNIAAAPA